MDRLHRGDDAKRPEAPEVLLAHELDVLEALAQRRRGDACRGDGIERDVHGAIADRVNRHRETSRRRARDIGPQLERIERQDAAVVGALVGLLERRRLRAECPVAEEFHVTELQPLVALTRTHSRLQRRLEVECLAVADLRWHTRSGERQREGPMRNPHHDPDLERSTVVRPLRGRVRARLLQRLDARDAPLQCLVLRAHGRGIAVRLGRGRHGAVGELVGPLLQHAGRDPGRVAKDRAALRSWCVLPDLRRAEGSGVEPTRVTVTAAHHRGPVPGHPIELRRGRPASPVVLVEAAAGEPRAGRELARPTADDLEGLVERLCGAQIDLGHLEAPPHEVHVRVEPARGHQSAAKIDALGARRVAREVGFAADRSDTTVTREKRLGRDTRTNVDPAAVEERVARHQPNPARPRSGTNFTAP